MKKNFKKFLSTILIITMLSLPLSTQSHAIKHIKNDTKMEDDKSKVLVTKEKEIEVKFNELTGMKVKGLLYRASKDGFSAESFHEKCDGHTDTVVIVKVRDGNIIGAYSSCGFGKTN